MRCRGCSTGSAAGLHLGPSDSIISSRVHSQATRNASLPTHRSACRRASCVAAARLRSLARAGRAAVHQSSDLSPGRWGGGGRQRLEEGRHALLCEAASPTQPSPAVGGVRAAVRRPQLCGGAGGAWSAARDPAAKRGLNVLVVVTLLWRGGRGACGFVGMAWRVCVRGGVRVE